MPSIFSENARKFCGDTGKALDYLERLTDRLTSPVLPPNPLLFAPAIAPKQTEWGREMRMVILRGLKQDACFEPLRQDERSEERRVGKEC